jgi:hypothetical protein
MSQLWELGRLVALCRYEPFGYTPQAFRHGPQSAIALPLASPHAHPMLSHVHSGLQRLNLISYQTAPALAIRVGSDTACILFTVSPHKHQRAQHLFSASVTEFPIWNGRYSRSGLLHTTCNPSPLAAVS